MGEKIKFYLNKPIYIYLIGLFFLIYKSLEYPPVFDWKLFIVFSIIYLIVVSFIKWLLITKLKVPNGLFLITTGLIFLLFFEQIIYIFAQFGTFRLRHIAVISISIITIVYMLFKKKQLNNLKFFNSLINYFLLLLITITVFFCVLKKIEPQKNQTQEIKKLHSDITKKNDIIWVLLDEYASNNFLAKELKFENNLSTSLANLGFFVNGNIKSRSDFTLFSICSLFTSTPPANFTNLISAEYLLQDNNTFKFLKSNNYEVKFFDFLFTKSEIPYEMHFFPRNYTEQIFYSTFYHYFIENYIKSEKQVDLYNQAVYDSLTNELKKNSSYPRFIWAHFLIPHAPFLRDSFGIKKTTNTNAAILNSKEIKEQYLSYLKYGNKIVLDIINSIPNWKEKTIIVSGDHGFRYNLKSNDPYRFATFAAIYYPNMDTAELKQIKYIQDIPFYLRY